MLHWQVRMAARFLEAAADRAEWVTVEEHEDGTLVFTAADECDQVARLVVSTKPPYKVEYSDEWGLLG